MIDKLREAGATIEAGDDWLRVRADARPRAVSVRTSEYPAFPTDMQAQLMALDCIADGTATITETIFENRFMHVNELLRLGAKIDVDGRVAVVQGVDRLSGATVMATDLRASAGLVLAGARRRRRDDVVDRIYHLDRGYDRMEAKLRALGADVERVRVVITLALSKGRILDETLPLLAAAGIDARRGPGDEPPPDRRHVAAPTCASSWSAPATCRPTCSTAAPTSASSASTRCSSTAARACTGRSTSASRAAG